MYDVTAFVLAPSPTVDGGYSGIRISWTAGENLSKGDIVYCKDKSGTPSCYKYEKAGADKSMPPRAVALADISADAAGNFLVYGTMRLDGWGFSTAADQGKTVWAGASGAPTLTEPTTAGDKKYVVGYLAKTNVILFTFPGGSGESATAEGGAPTLVSATINADGNALSLVFSEAVDFGAGGNTGWTIDMNGGAGEDLTYSAGSGTSTLSYTIGNRKIKTGEAGTVSYTQPGNGVEDGDDVDLSSISNFTVTNNSTVTASVDDSYAETNQSDDALLYAGAQYQSFTSGGGTLDSVKFYLKKVGSPTGNVYAKIYAHDGTYGVSSVPTGSALATSDALSAASLTTSYVLTTLSFTGANRIELENSTYYVVVLEFSGGDVSNYVGVGQDTSSSSHGGNDGYSDDPWTPEADNDLCFYVYTVD